MPGWKPLIPPAAKPPELYIERKKRDHNGYSSIYLILCRSLPLPNMFPWPHVGGCPEGDSSEVGVLGVEMEGWMALLTVLSRGMGRSGSRM